MKKTLYLHVGLPKTGTTYLQRSIYRCVTKSDRSSLEYFTVKDKNNPRHSQLSKCLLNGNLGKIDRQLAKYNGDLLITDEGITNFLYKFRCDNIYSFNEILKKHCYEPRIILTLREKEQWIDSYYNQIILNHHSQHLDYYGKGLTKEEFLRHPYVSKLLDFEQMKLDLASYFGADLNVFEYSSNVNFEISEFLGINHASFEEDRLHVSLNADVIEFVRVLNSILSGNTERFFWLKTLLMVYPELENNLTIKRSSNKSSGRLPRERVDYIESLIQSKIKDDGPKRVFSDVSDYLLKSTDEGENS